MIAKKTAMTIRGTSHSAMVLTPADRLQRRHDYMEKARACRAIIEKIMPSVLEDACIKLLTAAENDPVLAELPFHPGAVPLLSRDWHQNSGCSRPRELIGFGAGNDMAMT